MKEQPWDLNQTWPVGRKWCWFTNAPKNFGAALPPNSWRKNIKFWATFSRLPHSTPHNSGTKCTNQNVLIYSVSPKSWLTFRDDPKTAEIHSVIVTHPSAATIKGATCLVTSWVSFACLPWDRLDRKGSL